MKVRWVADMPKSHQAKITPSPTINGKYFLSASLSLPQNYRFIFILTFRIWFSDFVIAICRLFCFVTVASRKKKFLKLNFDRWMDGYTLYELSDTKAKQKIEEKKKKRKTKKKHAHVCVQKKREPVNRNKSQLFEISVACLVLNTHTRKVWLLMLLCVYSHSLEFMQLCNALWLNHFFLHSSLPFFSNYMFQALFRLTQKKSLKKNK